MSERKLEPTPGWCERVYKLFTEGDRDWPRTMANLRAEYEAAQEPRTYTAAEAEKLCRERPEEVEAVNRRGMVSRIRKGDKAAQQVCGDRWLTVTTPTAFKPSNESYTIREVTPELKEAEKLCQGCAKPLGDRAPLFDFCANCLGEPKQDEPLRHEWEWMPFTGAHKCTYCDVIRYPHIAQQPCPARNKKPEPEKPAEGDKSTADKKPAVNVAAIYWVADAICRNHAYSMSTTQSALMNFAEHVLTEVDRRIAEAKPTTEALYQLIHDIADERIAAANVVTERVTPGNWVQHRQLRIKPGDK